MLNLSIWRMHARPAPVVTLFPSGAGANVEESYGHAVVLVGYNNNENYWVVRSSWGPKVGIDGYFKVAYGASGVADASNTWGLRFAPLKPAPAYLPSQVSSASPQGCYYYKASSDDYFSKVADKFAVSVKQLMLDNLDSVDDPADSLAGRTIKVCNATEVADVLPPASQLDALLRIKAAIDPNNALTTWKSNSPARAYCSWQGIRCDSSGDVKWISLGPNEVGEKSRLGGVLPEADLLLALPKLARLSLLIQDLVGTLPESYAKLAQLEIISLSGNKLRGTLPASWGGMKNLTQLSLGGYTSGYDGQLKLQGNLLGGTLPSEWGSMANLRQLGLSLNTFTGTLPPSWGSLQLELLHLASNRLIGSIPNSWNTLITGGMRTFDVEGNRLSGSLRTEW